MEEIKRIIIIGLWIFCFFYGLYISIASFTDHKPFTRSYKFPDLIRLFGNFGRIIYILFGLILSVVALLMLLKVFDKGPWADVY